MSTSKTDIPPWQWNQYLITIASFTTFVGFTFVNPFLPLFIHRELGIESVQEVALWSGVLLAAAPLLSALSAPFWGRLADRYGYKAMVQRAIFTFIFIVGLMGFTQNVWQLLILRLLLGLLGGFNAMGMALITTITPQARTSEAVGLFQGARSFSNAFGPIMGGVLADQIGMRQTFYVSSILFIGAFLMIRYAYREDGQVSPPVRAARKEQSLWSIIRVPAFLAVMVALFMTQAVDQSFGPVLPLFVTVLEGSEATAATWTGIIISAAAVAATLSALVLGRIAMRYSPRGILLLTLLGGAVICVPLAFSRTTGELLLWRVLLGLLAGGSLTLAYTVGGKYIPAVLRGSGFGILTSAGLIGGAVSPIVFGALAGLNLRLVFGIDAVLYALTILWVLLALRRD
jgi:MFS transporter, DHA1 family, multidrug resistance protein